MVFWQQLYIQSQQQNLQQQEILTLQFNQDLNQTAEVNIAASPWVPSPAKGIVRILLERDGGEKTTRATSIVAYEPNSHFAPHTHPLGEEFFVLAGTFSDENGDYPAGTYVRNPPTSSHQPFSKEGCLIFVKLQQFQADDREQITIDTQSTDALDDTAWSRKVLFDNYERVELLTANKDTVFSNADFNHGAEILVLKGALFDQKNAYQEGSWLRFPNQKSFSYTAKAGTVLWLKSGHLSETR